ncbi:MAG: hypothetical protein V3V16_01555 [Melioribacteraceae bacterium]
MVLNVLNSLFEYFTNPASLVPNQIVLFLSMAIVCIELDGMFELVLEKFFQSIVDFVWWEQLENSRVIMIKYLIKISSS